MKGLKHWLLPLVTVLLIGAGGGMPWAAARIQDLRGVSTHEVLPFDPVSLTLRKDSEIGSVLRLLGNVYDQTEWPGETNLTEQGACQAAFDALEQMDQAGLLETDWMEQYDFVGPETGILPALKKEESSWYAYPELFISLDGSSAIIWYCLLWSSDTPVYNLLVDDSTGKAVTAYIACPSAGEPEAYYRRMERWTAFFESYYGFEITSIQETRSWDDRYEFICFFDPEDGLGEWGLCLCLYENEMDFWSCSPLDLYPLPLPASALIDSKEDVEFYNSSTSAALVHRSLTIARYSRSSSALTIKPAFAGGNRQ